MKRLKAKGVEVIVYEPDLHESEFFRSPVVSSLTEFKARSDIIVTNRRCEQLADVNDNLYTRDLFYTD